MDTDKYKVFMKVIETGSLTKAAAELGYTQSGVSHILNTIEKEWRVILLSRDRSGVMLTREGKRLLPHIRDVCESAAKLEKEIDAVHGRGGDLIRIGGFSSISTHFLPEIIRSFRKRHGNIEVNHIQGDYFDIVDWLHRGKIELGFVKMPVSREFESFGFGQDKLVVLLPAEHPLAGLEYLTMENLADEPFILLDDGTESEILGLYKQHLASPNVAFTSRDDFTVVSMVESGMGITILPELILHRTAYNIAVKEFRPLTYRKFGVAVKDPTSATPMVNLFLDFIRKEGEKTWERIYGAVRDRITAKERGR